MGEPGSGNPSGFVLVTLSETDQESGQDFTPFFLDVPAESVGKVYRACGNLQRISIEGKDYLKFGVTGLFGSVLIDPDGGRVVEAGREMDEVTLVNTSVDRFNECIRGLVGLYPFYPEDSENEDWERAAEEMEEMVRRIDAEGYVHNGFWYELRWDIANGDFA